MKKFLLTVCSAFLLAVGAEAQITLEHEYSNEIGFSQPINGEIKIFSYDNSELRIYNLDHSLEKTITLDLPEGLDKNGYDCYITYVSESLFDLDDGIEFLIEWEYYDSDLGQGFSFVGVFDETGTPLLEVPDFEGGYPNPSERPVVETDNGVKLILQEEDGEEKTRVYSLPGQLYNITSVETPAGVESLQAYPNPASDVVQIAYAIPEGQTQGALKIYNEQGILVKSFVVDETFDHLLLNVADFEQGVYTYRLEGNSFATEAEKLVVMR